MKEGRDEGAKGGREEGREGRREGGREGSREEGRKENCLLKGEAWQLHQRK